MTGPQKASPPPWFVLWILGFLLLIGWLGYLFVDLVKYYIEAIS